MAKCMFFPNLKKKILNSRNKKTEKNYHHIHYCDMTSYRHYAIANCIFKCANRIGPQSLDMKFDDISTLTLQDIKETKHFRLSDACTHVLENSVHRNNPQTQLGGGGGGGSKKKDNLFRKKIIL